MKESLENRNYPSNLINNGFEKAIKIPREELLSNEESNRKVKQKDGIALVQTFNPNFNNYFTDAQNASNHGQLK